MVVIYCYSERKNWKVLRFLKHDSSSFEIRIKSHNEISTEDA